MCRAFVAAYAGAVDDDDDAVDKRLSRHLSHNLTCSLYAGHTHWPLGSYTCMWKVRRRYWLIMLVYSTLSLFRSVDVFVVLLSLSRVHVLATACPGSKEDHSIQTCVDDLTLNAESWSIEALRTYYEDFPTHCRYGQYTTRAYSLRVGDELSYHLESAGKVSRRNQRK